jgi:hypothetical protein
VHGAEIRRRVARTLQRFLSAVRGWQQETSPWRRTLE